MATLKSLSFSHIILVVFMAIVVNATDEEDRKVHIVYMGALNPDQDGYSPSSQHLSILQQVLEGSSATESLVRSYKRSFNGFAAKLNERERQKLARMDGVVSVFPSRTLQLHTTRSWNFMGLTAATKRQLNAESDVIVGVFDTGIWPESESFSDKGFGPPPKKWKGTCNGGTNFTCNNKLIGARVYTEIEETARDREGHGTHTASTAAGNRVVGVSFYGMARGNARGGVPSARIAVYKVCSYIGCVEEDILSAFDDAIADGVDIISLSLGHSAAAELSADSLAIGTFHAMAKGILTSSSAGNFGPERGSTSSVAPWMFSVAASSIDRQIIDRLVLGDGTQLVGRSVNSFGSRRRSKVDLVYGTTASTLCDFTSVRRCSYGCLDRRLVKGKIVLCDKVSLGAEPMRAGALGVLMIDRVFNDVALTYPLPAVLLSSENGEKLKLYLNSTRNPQAKILKSEAIHDSSAPVVASFSSRGPSVIIPDIIKPDISAPGVNILAAFSPIASPSNDDGDTRSVEYSILSGTSMACPHVTGSAAYVKSFHPDWSPAALKSALMTTARRMSAVKNEDTVFAYGSGHIDPVKAKNPGLVYDAHKENYIEMLCNMGYDSRKVRLISGDNSSCPKARTGEAKDLNYPSMGRYVPDLKPFKTNFTRTVTNVGFPNSTYKAKVTSSGPEMKISVEPSVLSFKALNEKKSFVVTVSVGELSLKHPAVFGSLVWSDGIHRVRSPIAIYSDLPTN
ncbi:PREDICTED: subtilisin-like protease SBT4.3 [Nelumbo nucifera]|uniref:Subtilisin-like protease SBT4.3 n=2 Tax=Nelumbo nucifera TaxID=4432 RepID=A0A822Y352_NELNU|nr:PREDICTED: subtilisin-like protease SBT4.3 [Nelumbo nucifera]DAD28344.1 TPA_asm: hypothetical protein HUJ06_029812 [Nelumbo nucifera]